MWDLNDARFFPGDSAKNTERWQNPWQNIAQFLQRKYPLSPTEFSIFIIVSIQVLCNTSIGENLLVHCENKYDFSYMA